MNTHISKLQLNRLKDVLKQYRVLIFWLLWGFSSSMFFGHMLYDLKKYFLIFMSLGFVLGFSLQFIKQALLKRIIVTICIFIVFVIYWKPVLSLLQVTFESKITKSFLIEDVRQMVSILDETHPEPFIKGGGRVALHRKMQNIIKSIPEEGMTQIEFYKHLCPLLASVGDGHTSFWVPFNLDYNTPGGVPFYFKAVDNFLYIAGVINSKHKNLIGSKLISVESILFRELLDRQANIKGYDNEYQLMRNLGYDGSLWNKNLLRHLIPEWDETQISVELENTEGEYIELILKPNKKSLDSLLYFKSAIHLPTTEKSNYVYEYMVGDNNIVLMLIENMYTYRESFEMERVTQNSFRMGLAKELYQKYNGKTPPSNIDDLIDGIPSATELCRNLVIEMKKNKTEYLIIDLRRNQGGNAFLSTIFTYFFYGKEALISLRTNQSIFVKKYSNLFWKQYRGWDIDGVNENSNIELFENDYDFANYPEKENSLAREEILRIIENEASSAKTFWEEYISEEYSGYYQPKNIIILCSPLTSSSGYAFMHDHWSAGAKVVGIPPSQAGNSCGAWVGFQLDHSRLKGGVSHLYITHFRDDEKMGRTFRPDFELTYDDLKAFNFDSNTEILYTLRLIKDDKLNE